MYADDTTLTSSAEDLYVLEHKNKLCYEFNPVMADSKHATELTLNVKNTKCMLIGSKFKLSQIHNNF